MCDNIVKRKLFQYIYYSVLMFMACMIRIQRQEIYGAALFAIIIAVMLVISSRLTDAMLPALLMCVFLTRLYNPLENPTYKKQIFSIIWVAVLVVGAIIFHFVYYRRKFKIGRSFYGICAISVALILGGVGTISFSDYFAPTALFYVFALGIGMILFYLLVKSQLDEDAGQEIVSVMYLMGIFACFCVTMFYIDQFLYNASKGIEGIHSIPYFQSKNNLSTLLMFAMPFPAYYSAKNPTHILSVFVMYVCIIFTGSRGGLLMGTIEFGLIMIAYVLVYPKNIKQRVVAITIALLFACGVLCFIPIIAYLNGISGDSGGVITNVSDLIAKIKGYLVKDDESRFLLLGRMGDDFKANPLFGRGIGYTGHEDIWAPKSGAMNWYHMWFAQVIGGLGLCGILAYGYQLVDRLIIFFKNKNDLTVTLLLSYSGLFLMSQVNPGEFCPFPYSMLAVTFFIIMEAPLPCRTLGRREKLVEAIVAADEKDALASKEPCEQQEQDEQN
ncbi:MAG: O-antigen ligase family protein [Ruminococcaceae bacterium]|nr:O-antigen ligase family protein [Oscillospiraceae bacterium]